MFKKPRISWIIAVLLYVALLALVYVVTYVTEDIGEDQMFIPFELFASAAIILSCSSTLGALAAFIPFKNLKYLQKFRSTFPLATILMIGVLICVYGRLAYLVNKYGAEKPTDTSKSYDEVQISPSLNCSSVHDGLFEMNTLIIERHGDRQTQTFKLNDEKMEFNVKWISDCEYYLTSREDTTAVVKIKIVNVETAGYDYYAAINMNNIARKFRINITKVKK